MRMLKDNLHTPVVGDLEVAQERDPLNEASGAPTPNIFDRLNNAFENAKAYIAIGLLAVGTAVSLAPPAKAKGAKAKIVVGQGIDGANIGATTSQIRQELGRPSFSRPPSQGETVWDYFSPRDLALTFSKGKLSGMFTTNEQFTTSKGVGVGSSPQQIKEAYPQAKCTPGAGPGGPNSLACVLDSKQGGVSAQTIFEFTSPAAGVEEVDIDRT